MEKIKKRISRHFYTLYEEVLWPEPDIVTVSSRKSQAFCFRSMFRLAPTDGLGSGTPERPGPRAPEAENKDGIPVDHVFVGFGTVGFSAP